MHWIPDPARPSILNTGGKVVIYNNKVCLNLKQEIKALMKNDKYQVEVTFNNSEIVSCSCNCKAGGYDKDKIMCVHVLPVLLQYTILLF